MSVTTKKALPQANGDFYAIGTTISEEDQALKEAFGGATGTTTLSGGGSVN